MLRAAWLGHWKAPWGLNRGRRWGDSAWTLAALSQAWLLGGREGLWPRLEPQVRRPQGPVVAAWPTEFTARPDPRWIALLRHGSAQIPADRRGHREDEATAWAWEALLAGDGVPWMAIGTLKADLPLRLQWVAVLGAVDAGGTLQLPPFLEGLVPASLRSLPQGWWETLLRAQDAEGRLLPAGPLEPSLPWNHLQPLAEPLGWPSLPQPLEAYRGAPWLCELKDGAWCLDPRLRAWGRGWGASPQGLLPLLPENLSTGGPPEAKIAALLRQEVPTLLPPAWQRAIQADLREDLTRPGPPAAIGHPTLDRLRMRWGGEAARPEPGYPDWGAEASPCADPFHWMAQGRLHGLASRPEAALRAWTLAYNHFQRLGAQAWADRAASNAAAMALEWADLPAHHRWAALRGPLPQPWQDLEAAYLAEVNAAPVEAQARFQALVEAYPEFTAAWMALASFGADHERWELVREALPHVSGTALEPFLQAALGPLDAPAPDEADPETQTNWEAHRLLRGAGDPTRFWQLWRSCPNQVMRLVLGVRVLEQRPELTQVGILLGLQALADRAQANRYQQRLAALWPTPEASLQLAPAAFIERWLQQQRTPLWLVWQEGLRLRKLGTGAPPPEGSLGRLASEGTLPAFQDGAWIWRGYPLVWEGVPVGSLLQALPADARPEPSLEPLLLAPWLAQLRQQAPPATLPEAGFLWTDGSEPMASVLRELDRVAPSDLSILILGPTGSGKELAARELHQRSSRTGALVAVNCSAFAESLMESELFGHVKGAFTGAHQDRRGAIEMARGGTLFLDEVADLSPRLQSLLLRVLQEHEVRRVGSDHAIKVDVRFLAATHRSLDELVANGSFRQDLLFRLQGAVLKLPPLSARRHEFPFLIPRLLIRAAEAAKRPVPALAPGLAQALARLPWPGNVRELLHALERALLRCEGGTLKPVHFPELAAPPLHTGTWDEATSDFQRQFLLATLRTHRFRMADAAQTLGLARPALYALAKRLGVDLVAERAGRQHPQG